MSEAHRTPAAAANAAASTDVGGFLAQVPEGIRGEAYFKDIKDVGSLANKAFHQAKLIGRDPSTMVVIPGAEDAESWGQVYDRLGRPANPDSYGLKAPAQLPEGLSLDAELQQRFAAKAHEVGLSARQAAALHDWWNGERASAHTATTTASRAAEEAAVKALQGDPSFGGAAFEQNVALARAALSHFGSDELAAELDRTGLGNHPQIVKMFAKIGKELAEDGVIGAHAGGQPGALTPDQARQQRSALQADKEFMARYRNPNRAIRQAAIDQMLVLNEAIAAGNAGAAP